MPSDHNSETELIKLLEKVLSDFFKDERHAMAGFAARLTVLEQNEAIRHQQLMTALETLTASVTAGTAGQADLTAAVNAAIVRLGSPGATDAQLLTLAAAVDGLNASDVSLKDALLAALNPPPPAP